MRIKAILSWAWALPLLAACAALQNPIPQAILATQPLVYVPEAWVEERRAEAGVEVVRFRTERSRTMGELWEDIQRGLEAGRVPVRCSEVLGLPLGEGPYLVFRLPLDGARDLAVRVLPLDGYALLGHSLFRAELHRPPARSVLLGCPID